MGRYDYIPQTRITYHAFGLDKKSTASAVLFLTEKKGCELLQKMMHRHRRYDVLRFAQYDMNSLHSFIMRSVP